MPATLAAVEAVAILMYHYVEWTKAKGPRQAGSALPSSSKVDGR